MGGTRVDRAAKVGTCQDFDCKEQPWGDLFVICSTKTDFFGKLWDVFFWCEKKWRCFAWGVFQLGDAWCFASFGAGGNHGSLEFDCDLIKSSKPCYHVPRDIFWGGASDGG